MAVSTDEFFNLDNFNLALRNDVELNAMQEAEFDNTIIEVVLLAHARKYKLTVQDEAFLKKQKFEEATIESIKQTLTEYLSETKADVVNTRKSFELPNADKMRAAKLNNDFISYIFPPSQVAQNAPAKSQVVTRVPAKSQPTVKTQATAPAKAPAKMAANTQLEQKLIMDPPNQVNAVQAQPTTGQPAIQTAVQATTRPAQKTPVSDRQGQATVYDSTGDLIPVTPNLVISNAPAPRVSIPAAATQQQPKPPVQRQAQPRQVQTNQPQVQTVQPQARPAQPTQTQVQTVQPQARPAQPIQPQVQTVQPQARPTQPTQTQVQTVQPQVRPAQPIQPQVQTVQPQVRPTQPTQTQVQTVQPQVRPAQPIQPQVQTVQPQAQPAQTQAQNQSQPVAVQAQAAVQQQSTIVPRTLTPPTPIANPSVVIQRSDASIHFPQQEFHEQKVIQDLAHIPGKNKGAEYNDDVYFYSNFGIAAGERFRNVKVTYRFEVWNEPNQRWETITKTVPFPQVLKDPNERSPQQDGQEGMVGIYGPYTFQDTHKVQQQPSTAYASPRPSHAHSAQRQFSRTADNLTTPQASLHMNGIAQNNGAGLQPRALFAQQDPQLNTPRGQELLTAYQATLPRSLSANHLRSGSADGVPLLRTPSSDSGEGQGLTEQTQTAALRTGNVNSRTQRAE